MNKSLKAFIICVIMGSVMLIALKAFINYKNQPTESNENIIEVTRETRGSFFCSQTVKNVFKPLSDNSDPIVCKLGDSDSNFNMKILSLSTFLIIKQYNLDPDSKIIAMLSENRVLTAKQEYIKKNPELISKIVSLYFRTVKESQKSCTKECEDIKGLAGLERKSQKLVYTTIGNPIVIEPLIQEEYDKSITAKTTFELNVDFSESKVQKKSTTNKM